MELQSILKKILKRMQIFKAQAIFEMSCNNPTVFYIYYNNNCIYNKYYFCWFSNDKTKIRKNNSKTKAILR